MNLSELIAAAESAEPPAPVKFSVVPLIPVIDVLRRRQFRWADVHRWLLKQGAAVHPDVRQFTSAACQVYRRWLERARRSQIEREAPRSNAKRP